MVKPQTGNALTSTLFALFALADLWQLFQAARGAHPDPPSLLITHGITGSLAAIAVLGIWQSRRWALPVVIAWGFLTSGMFVAMGPVLGMPADERPQLAIVAGVVAVFTAAVAWYLQRRRRLAK
jgi:hypothetical protein